MELKEFFTKNPKVALAFSGGVDSSYLLFISKALGAEVKAYYVKSQFQPEFEFMDAMRLVDELGANCEVINVDVLASSVVTSNPANRCYYCKRVIFETIVEAAKRDGFSVLIDGTNASDKVDDRPGMKALKELSVKSPLRICGLSKSDIRNLSKDAGLFTWNKPSYACLATRIKTGEVITEEKLKATEICEDYLFSLGLKDFRVRRIGDEAKLEISEMDMPIALEKRKEIDEFLSKYYSSVQEKMEVRKSE